MTNYREEAKEAMKKYSREVVTPWVDDCLYRALLGWPQRPLSEFRASKPRPYRPRPRPRPR